MVALLGLLVPGMATALSLDDAKCQTLSAELKVLESQGAAQDLLAGPQWAEANLSADRITALRQYILLKEDVLFRCPSLYPAIQPDPAAGDIIYGPPLPPEMIAKIKAKEEERRKKAAAKAAKAAALKKAKAEKARKKKEAAAAGAGTTVAPAEPAPSQPDAAATEPAPATPPAPADGQAPSGTAAN